jgi:hypothetical protein
LGVEAAVLDHDWGSGISIVHGISNPGIMGGGLSIFTLAVPASNDETAGPVTGGTGTEAL